MAASSSNAALGFLTLAPLVRQLGRLVGEQPPTKYTAWWGGAVSRAASLLESMANLFVLGWAFSFLRSLMRYAGFYARQKGSSFTWCPVWSPVGMC